MNLKAILAAAATVMIISIPGAVAQMQGMDMQKMMPQADDTASTKDMKQAHMEMMKNMNLDFTGNPDVDFARSMVKHHESAIVMAKIQLKHGKDPEIRQMAEKIIKDQQTEIAEFNSWLRNHTK
ncbi:MAG: DUF305 domain-containing protein [Rhizobiales bacterium]|nr:DUF305 domain-containing protein [Hyphomicrobiales bacterium]OJY41890.1 MAG: hypothetical protein BGP08_11120 [Rhizobiales bacterium 64-17]